MRKNQHAMECQTSFKGYEWSTHTGIGANMYSSKTVMFKCVAWNILRDIYIAKYLMFSV